MKTCLECGETKPLEEFHVHPLAGRHPRCKICRNAENRARAKALSPGKKKLRRMAKRASHQRAKARYKARIKKEKLEAEIKANESLYLVVKAEIEAGCTYCDIRLAHDLSVRFLKRLLEYEGHCYKTETVIDRIKPALDTEYGETGLREYTWPWLKSPLSRYSMRVDLFYPQINLAVEFNGPHYYKEIGYGNLDEVKARDRAKYGLLSKHDADLRIITDEESIIKDLN